MDDGFEQEFGPGDVSNIPPGHDAWVVGQEPVVIGGYLRNGSLREIVGSRELLSWLHFRQHRFDGRHDLRRCINCKIA